MPHGRSAQRAGTVSVPGPVVEVFRSSLLTWFRRHGRRFPWRKSGLSLYRLIVPELLLQRTRAEVVAAFLPAFLEKYPNWPALAQATEEELGAYLRPLGLWRRRAASLGALARAMSVRRGRFPQTRDEVEALPGVGQYIANAILLFAARQPEPLLDVTMARVLERCFGPRQLVDIRYDPHLQEVSRRVLRGSDESIRLNWAMLDLGALVCTRNEPRCQDCPLNQVCALGKHRLGSRDHGPHRPQ